MGFDDVVSYKVFDKDGNGFITQERMNELLYSISKGISRATSKDLPFPFDSNEGILKWIDTAFMELERLNGIMNMKAFHVVAKSSGWSLSLCTFGCYLPSEEKSLDFPLSPPVNLSVKQKPKQRSKSTSSKRKSVPKFPATESEPTVSKAFLEEMENMKSKLKEFEKRESRLLKQIKVLTSHMEKKKKKEEEEEEDEWTDSEQEDDVIVMHAEETLEEQNERLIVQVRSLQTGLKQFMEANQELKKENCELMEINESLKGVARKLQRQNGDISLPPDEVELLAAPVHTNDAMMKQIEDYHSLLSWHLQKDKIVHPDGSSEAPVPPGDVRRIDVIMKRGDFIQSWKKRLAVVTKSSIIYYADPPKPQGQIDLRQIRAVRDTQESGSLPYTVELLTPDRVWTLSFNSKQQLQEWKSMLDSISKDNIARIESIREKKRMAAERERQRLENERKAAKVRQPRTPTRTSDLWST